MLLRQFPHRFCRSLSTEVNLTSASASTSTAVVPIVHRDTHTSTSSPGITDSIPKLSADAAGPSISLTYPKASVSESRANLNKGATARPISEMDGASEIPPLVASSKVPSYSRPPFHTHQFFVALEKTFPPPTARSLMRATRALLVDRLGNVRREGLTVKDLDNVRVHPSFRFILTSDRRSQSKHIYFVQLSQNYVQR